MSGEPELPVAERLHRLLRHLGIDRAHVAGRLAADWAGLVSRYPEMVASLTLLNSFEPSMVAPLAERLLVVTGDQGPMAESVRNAMAGLPGARHVCLDDYNLLGWSDVAVERGQQLGDAMLQFLAGIAVPAAHAGAALPEGEGEVAGITYRLRGAGPPLVLLPLFLAPSQWEPLVPPLAEQFCTITLGGAALGAAAVLESRGRAAGYLRMVANLIEETRLRPGESVLEVGCGTGVLDRWLVRRTAQANRITGVDINRYLLREAAALARRDGFDGAIDFREGNAEALPFPDAAFDVVMSVTVIEEADADRMLAEMVRVTKPGGRVAVIARSVDMPFLMNVSLSPGLKAKVEMPGAVGGVAPQGCADASLYRRARRGARAGQNAAAVAGLRPCRQIYAGFHAGEPPATAEPGRRPRMAGGARAGRGGGNLLHGLAASLRGRDEAELKNSKTVGG
jgi:SAM-dependent methyltransferase